ncbi:DNA-binding global transcriptional regulator BolA [Commensalibacter communis]|uniref:Affects cell shape n=1 Tax=Commensalibacter communis TaxID=2972786 RepID=A0A9W4XHE9_9PROT|nr:BolA/IbaG family iron-sulfur metabolism protein [Commensalibacter communis]CAI3923159.1 DNA-binding global transcriptional regulator BolA [Commensalibacter communis]CAI3927146.1 DNA-binding global transcriptional regulator BolA [Commensalibacter communis]CAI3927739.1 DNA-binding global transcriptional regulator BolA [Commensalibacter communis]CAI3933720.1 DNA-binding global transcriptional regulator BolA [Commensalibacter communis]CAI3935021.1 DNA-binding global transcriptional regulator Bo
MDVSEIDERLRNAFPDANIDVGALKKDGRHFYCKIAAKEFEGLNKVKQHQLVYKALEDYLDGDLHALALETSALSN